MATINQLIADVTRQLSALKVTDDSKLSPDHIYFVLTHCAAKLESDKIVSAISVMGGVISRNPYPSLYSEYEVGVNCDTMEATLPVPPISLPMDEGLGGVYYYDKFERIYRQVLPVSHWRLTNSQNMWFRNRMVTRFGNTLRFSNVDGLKKVRLLLLSSSVPRDEQGNIDINSQFPISEDLVFDLVDMATKLLFRSQSIPEDSVNDNKDISS
jgi:hypothetical protein